MSEIVQLLKRTSVLVIVIGIIVLLIGASGDIQLGSFAFKLPDELTRWIIEGVGLALVLFGIFLEWQDSSGKKSGAIQASHVQKFDKQSSIVVSRERLEKAQTIDWMAFSMYKTLSIYDKELVQCLRSNGQIRLLLINPKAELPEMTARLGYSLDKQKVETDITATSARVNAWKENIPGCKVEIRYLSGLPPYRIMIVNRILDTGYIRLRLFVTPGTADAPTVALTTKSDKEWFTFFCQQFENFWNIATPAKFEKEK
jgi:hypothetical protein